VTDWLREDGLCEGFSLAYLSDVCFERLLFYYAEWQKVYHRLQYDTCVKEQRWGCSNTKTAKKKNIIEFREGLPSLEDYSNYLLSLKLVIIDDLMRESSSRGAIVNLFTKSSHHKNLSVILIS